MLLRASCGCLMAGGVACAGVGVTKASGDGAGKENTELLPKAALPMPVPRDGALEFEDAAEAANGNEKPENGAAKLLLPNKEPLVLPKPNDGSAGSANSVFVAVKSRKVGEN